MYNKNMQNEIANGICLPLGKEFKKDRFKSMTGYWWVDEYEGVIRWDKIKRVGEDLDNKAMVYQTDQVGSANASSAE